MHLVGCYSYTRNSICKVNIIQKKEQICENMSQFSENRKIIKKEATKTL
jgi:hypothetical protein